MSDDNYFSLVVCELFNQSIHGFTSTSDPVVKTHFLVLESELENMSWDERNETVDFYQESCQNYEGTQLIHPIFKNYENMVTSDNDNYIQLHIAKLVYLEGDECVGIIKTFWIKWIQRVWKKVFNKRKQVIAHRCNPESLLYRELYGTWPDHCYRMPSLKGMLSFSSSPSE